MNWPWKMARTYKNALRPNTVRQTDAYLPFADLGSDCGGKDIYLSFFSDFALLQGETIRQTDPSFGGEV
jgi:hypothetical protein